VLRRLTSGGVLRWLGGGGLRGTLLRLAGSGGTIADASYPRRTASRKAQKTSHVS
jgi:hypothetical protein